VTALDSVNRRRDVQGLRGLAVLLVVFYHSGWLLPGGFVGVDVFFVISGYVITASLQREWLATGAVRLRSFYARRVKRLFPALSVVTVSVVVASILLQSPNGPQQETAKTAFGATLTVSNFVIFRSIGSYFSPIAKDNPLLHTWSLSVEEQFFLIFPAVLALGWTIAHRRSTSRSLAAWLVVGGLAVPSILLSLVTSYSLLDIPFVSRSPLSFAFYSSMTRAWEFAVGALLVLLATQLRRLPDLRKVGLCLIVGSALVLSDSYTFPGLAALVPVLGATLIIASGSNGSAGRWPSLDNRALVWIGDISYSWYLWHWPILVFTRLHLSESWWVVIGAVALSLIPAHLSYRYVELPILQSSRLVGRRVLGIAFLTLVVPVLATSVLAAGARTGWGQDWAIGSSEVVRSGCDHGSFDPDTCTWTVEASKGVVLLAGDSQSWAVADGLIAAAGDQGYNTTVATLNGCSFIYPSSELQPPGQPSECQEFRSSVLDFASTTELAAVVVSNWSLGYVGDTPESSQRWEDGLAGAFDVFSEKGVPVILFSSYPKGDDISGTRTFLTRPDPDRWTDARSRRSDRAWLIELETDLAARYEGVDVYDPYQVLCDQRFCRVAVGGTEYYTDSNHLSRAGSLQLAHSLETLLGSSISRATG